MSLDLSKLSFRRIETPKTDLTLVTRKFSAPFGWFSQLNIISSEQLTTNKNNKKKKKKKNRETKPMTTRNRPNYKHSAVTKCIENTLWRIWYMDLPIPGEWNLLFIQNSSANIDYTNTSSYNPNRINTNLCSL